MPFTDMNVQAARGVDEDVKVGIKGMQDLLNLFDGLAAQGKRWTSYFDPREAGTGPAGVHPLRARVDRPIGDHTPLVVALFEPPCALIRVHQEPALAQDPDHMAPDHDIEFLLLRIGIIIDISHNGSSGHVGLVSFRLESNDKLKFHSEGKLNRCLHLNMLSTAGLYLKMSEKYDKWESKTVMNASMISEKVN